MANLEYGKRLADRYLLQQRLGDGGHAEVWAALDTREGRRVALKFLRPASCPAQQGWHVLQHEAEMSQRLDHPGVLRVEPPQRDGDWVFLPMECADGGDVRALRGAPWRQVLPVLLQVAAILEHAHSRGVVHRDIKPGNVLFDAAGRVRVSDFGTAARTGLQALADGSPFSASPQQLQGQPATTADDVYGLGALAYELLSRYPPYYPDFDARRVQQQMPSTLVAVHPAPPRLLAFVMSMLERQPRQRPDMRQVIEFFTQCLQGESAGEGEGAAMVVTDGAPPALPGPTQASRGLRFATLGLVGAACIAVLVFVFMPAPKLDEALPPAVAAVSQSPAESAPASDQPAAPAGVESELAAGHAALAISQPVAARAAFERALLREPGNAAAQAGIAASQKLAQVLDAYSAGMRLEAAGDTAAARSRYASALAVDRRFAPAQAAMDRVRQLERARAYETALERGAELLVAGRVDAAEQQYQRAVQLGGEDTRVLEGRERIAEIRRSDRNARDMTRGAVLEQQENWAEAVQHYGEVLMRDASLHFAVDGLARSQRRAELDHELQDYLDRSDRLVAPAVRAAAMRALARGEATTGATMRLGSQLRQLKARLQALDVKVRVEISSDNSTFVILAPLGELGVFDHRAIELPPGQYTVIGRREGFRDVRRVLDILPGQPAPALTVQCSERI